MIRPLLVPYLMGQRREGLLRMPTLDDQPWHVVQLPALDATQVPDRNRQMRNMGQLYAQLATVVRQTVGDGLLPVSLAGDCVSSIGMLAGLQQAGREPQRILWLDAHGDFHCWESTPTKYIGGMPLAIMTGRRDRRYDERDSFGAFRTALGVRPYPGARIVLSDARDLDPGEGEVLARSDIVRCPLDQVLAHLAPQESLYLHFDTDVLDEPQRMPALKYHVPNGPRLEQVATLFRALRDYPIAALSVSGWHAELDSNGSTAGACHALLCDLLAR